MGLKPNFLPDRFASKSLVAFCFLLVSVIFLWPSILVGQYFWFFDTVGYLSSGSQALNSVFKGSLPGLVDTGAPLQDAQSYNDIGVPAPVVGGSADAASDTVMGGRSPYYGAMLAIASATGTLWPVVLFQALIVSVTLFLSARIFLPNNKAACFLIIAVTGFSTTVSFFVIYLMPDIYAGLSIVAASALLAGWHFYRRFERVFLAGVIAFSCASHTSHSALIVLVLIAALAAKYILQRRIETPAVQAVLVSLILGALALAAVPVIAERQLDKRVVSPPFLVARVVADGPGLKLLKARCPEAGYVLCAYVDRLPVENSDVFLWADKGDGGIVSAMSATELQALADEQIRFVLDAIAFDPFGQLSASAQNFIEQLTAISLQEFAYTDAVLSYLQKNLHHAEYSKVVEARSATELYGLLEVGAIYTIVVIVSLLVIIYLMCATVGKKRGRPVLEVGSNFVIIALCGVVANAGITGILSMPHDRYQARVVWIIPFVALLLLSKKFFEKEFSIGKRDV